MNNANRRTFIKTASAGAAAAGAVALVPGATAATVAAQTPAAATPVAEVALPAGASGAMVAYVKDVASGEVSVMVEGREVTVTDHQLVARIAHAMHSNSKV